MRPWMFEANDIDLKDVNIDSIYHYVVRTQAVEEFLKCGSDDMKFFIVGPKGLGKTFLLKVKSKFYRENMSGYRCLPPNELVEKLTAIRVSFSREELGKFTLIDTWEKTWELSLVTMILRNFGIELPADLRTLIGGARTLLDILSAFIRSRNAIDKLYSEHLSTSLRPKLDDLREHGANQIAVFIDNVDEGIEKHGSQSKGRRAEDVWINAQLGLMKVARDICQRNRHIKIFVSIRSEAFNNDRSATALQARNSAIILEYTRNQIKEIFEQNISTTRRSDLARPHAANLIERFVGFSQMPHNFAKDLSGNPRKEDTFSFIFRHTFGRPREIVRMGNIIAQIPVNERRDDEDAVREKVNTVSNELLQQLRQEIVPSFEDEVFNRFCELVKHNVVSIEEAKSISRQIQDETGFDEDVFSYLYSIGLVGATEYDWKREREIQRFLPVGHYSLSDPVPPRASNHLVLHSSIDKLLRTNHGRRFYDKNNIIGDGLDFSPPITELPTGKPLHIHFGLGRDGLTLIVPEVSRDKAVAIIQKPSRDNHELSQARFVELRTSSYQPIRFTVVHDKDNENQISDAINAWRGGDNILVYSNNPQLVGKMLDLCETITLWSSSFLAAPTEEDLLPSFSLDEMSSDTQKKVIYLCQRVINKKILAGLKEQVRSKSLEDKLSVRTFLIDRLEHKKSTVLEGDTLAYEVEAEVYGSIVCQERAGSNNQNNQVVRRTKNQKEQNFYEDLQKYLTEGIYRLVKMVNKRISDKPIDHLDEIYDLFYDIQIAHLASRHKLSGIYTNKTQTEIVSDLKKFCNDQRERFSALTQFPKFVDTQDNYVRDSKRMGAFPSDRAFLKLARESPQFLNSRAVMELQSLLRVRPLSDYYSVFICFSVKDEPFAKSISDCLKKRGVDAYFFREDHRPGEIKSVEKKEIAERDKILFVASENSITSTECQEELSLGMTQRKNRLNDPNKQSKVKDIFVPITIDQFIFNVGEAELESRVNNWQEAWRNLNLIRQHVTSDFSGFRDEQGDDRFEQKVDREIIPALQKTLTSKPTSKRNS
ncbi:MAG TPA: toll/interleukin-1 receptor domain-containing protein [Pyrinomonadaceae bacterium]